MRGWRLLAALCLSLVMVAGCGDDNPTSPTPRPRPPPRRPLRRTPTPTPPTPAALDSLVIAPASVEGQFQPTGDGHAHRGGPRRRGGGRARSGNTDAAKVPASVTVPAGSTTATFTVDTSTVPTHAQVTIQASYLGVTKTFVLTVRAPALGAARFTVISASRGNNACEIVNASGAVDCRLDASATGGFVARYIWVLTVGSREYVVLDR